MRIKEFSIYEDKMEKLVFFISVCVILLALVAGRALAGITFYPPDKRLDVGDPPGNSYSGSSSICADDNGWIYVAWDDGRNNAENDDIYFNSSSNYGATWLNNDIRVDTDLPGAGNSYMWSRAITCDDNGHVYTAWIDERSGRASYPQDIFFNASANHGQTWMENDKRLNRINQGTVPRGTMPEIACTQKGQVYVVWYDYRWERNRIYLNYSHDYGQTWLENDIHIDNLTEGPGDEFYCWYPDVACDENGHVYVVWETRDSQPRIGFRRSNDYGVTWQACQKIDNYVENAKWVLSPRIACDGNGNIYIAWEDYRHDNNNLGYTDIYFNYSHDYGATWGTNIRLTTGKLPGSSPSDDDSGSLWMSCDNNGHVYVAWVDRRNGNADIYFNHSSNYGVTWQTSDIRLDTGTSPGYYTSWHPTMACDGSGNVFVVWDDDRNGRRDIYMNYSTNYGSSWQTSDIRVDTDNAGYGQSMWPMVATSNGRPFIVWDDLRNCTPPALPSVNADIYFQSYTLAWTGTATFKLENLYKVSLDKNLQLNTGSKLVVKFYKYDNVTLQANSVIDSIMPPQSVVENENVPHPRAAEGFSWGTVQIARLVLTTENENEVISTIASFTVHQSDLRIRYGNILRAWGNQPEQQSAFRAEIGDILRQWSSAPP